MPQIIPKDEDLDLRFTLWSSVQVSAKGRPRLSKSDSLADYPMHNMADYILSADMMSEIVWQIIPCIIWQTIFYQQIILTHILAMMSEIVWQIIPCIIWQTIFYQQIILTHILANDVRDSLADYPMHNLADYDNI